MVGDYLEAGFLLYSSEKTAHLFVRQWKALSAFLAYQVMMDGVLDRFEDLYSIIHIGHRDFPAAHQALEGAVNGRGVQGG
jgi:hypothetical protein